MVARRRHRRRLRDDRRAAWKGNRVLRPCICSWVPVLFTRTRT